MTGSMNAGIRSTVIHVDTTGSSGITGGAGTLKPVDNVLENVAHAHTDTDTC